MNFMKKITLVAGARPNFMKIAPIIHAIQADGELEFRLVHTGQHYDKVMSGTFFQELSIPIPNVNLECGGGSQSEQTFKIMIAFEKELLNHKPDIVLVVGDVTSTMACSLAAAKMNIPVAHVEAGIRSFDMSMPEEINRIATDQVVDYFFTTTQYASDMLTDRGADSSKVYFVGNVMIDTLLSNIPKLVKPDCFNTLALENKKYVVLTMHRPDNVDNPSHLKEMLTAVLSSLGDIKVVFPIHPRTAQKIKQINIPFDNLHLIEPLGYLEFNYLVKNSLAVITDSGGVTEETTVMGVPCVTLRENTERPETCWIGTNELIGTSPQNIAPAIDKLLKGNWKKGGIPEKWDGHTSERIVEIIKNLK